MKKILTILVLLFTTNIFTQNKVNEFHQFDIYFEGELRNYICKDLNNDGLSDILTITSLKDKKKTKRIIGIYFQKTGGFSTKPEQLIDCPKEWISIDVGNINDTPENEILLTTDKGVFYLPLVNKFEFSKEVLSLIEFENKFMKPNSEVLCNFDITRDINNDGIDEILFFTNYYIFVYRFNGSYLLDSKLNCDANFSITYYNKNARDVLSFELEFPDIFFLDWNADKLLDIILYRNRELNVFLANSGSTFYNSTPSKTINLYFDEENRPDEDVLFSLKHLSDLDSDGFIDMIISSEEIISSDNNEDFDAKNTLFIFKGENTKTNILYGDGTNKEPTQYIKSEGVSEELYLYDINNDGKKDLLFPEFKVGIGKIIWSLIKRKFSFKAKFYLMEKNNLYPDEPNLEKDFSIKINFSRGGGSGSAVFSVEGDFNGDNLKDFISKKDDDKLQIYFAKKVTSEVYDDDPDFIFETRVPSRQSFIKILDINSDYKSDIILRYSKQDFSKEEFLKEPNFLRILIISS